MPLLFVLVLALVISGCSLVLPESSGASARAGNYVATLIQAEIPGIPSLNHRENDRYRLSLLLHSVDGLSRHFVHQ